MPASRRQLKSSRTNKGVSILEITMAAFLMTVLAALGLNLTLIYLGLNINDCACRDAARAAGQQSTAASAILAAQAQLRIHATDGYWLTQPSLVSGSSPYFVYNDFAGNPPVNTSPYVTVTSVTNIRCPAPIFFFGAKFINGGSIQFTRRYTFPIIKEKFYG